MQYVSPTRLARVWPARYIELRGAVLGIKIPKMYLHKRINQPDQQVSNVLTAAATLVLCPPHARKSKPIFGAAGSSDATQNAEVGGSAPAVSASISTSSGSLSSSSSEDGDEASVVTCTVCLAAYEEEEVVSGCVRCGCTGTL